LIQLRPPKILMQAKGAEEGTGCLALTLNALALHRIESELYKG